MDATHTYLPSYVVEVLALEYMQEMRVFDFDEGLQYIFSQLRDLESDFVFHLCPDAARAGITSAECGELLARTQAMVSRCGIETSPRSAENTNVDLCWVNAGWAASI